MIVDLLIGSNTMLSTLEIFLHGTCFYVLLLILLIGLRRRRREG
ncbi:MAG: hypothetical protein QXO37_09395 [Candidatus Nitrosocaldaceae archaeon]